jgi:hypothetical protein
VGQSPHRRRPLVVDLATGVLAIAATLFIGATPAAAATPDLTTDSGGAPLMTGSNLRPGHSIENCLALTYSNLPSGSNGIGMYGAPSGSGLADYLDMTVEVGTGGVFNDCSAFTGAEVFRGTLAEFGQDHGTGASQLLLATVEGDTGQISIRVQLRLRGNNQAQGKTASAAFSWTVGSVTPGPPPPTASPSSSPAQPGATPSPTSTSPSVSPDPASGSGSESPSPSNTSDQAPSLPLTIEDPVGTSDPTDSVPIGQPSDFTTGGGSASGPVPVGPPLQTVTVPLLPGDPADPSASASTDPSEGAGAGASGSDSGDGGGPQSSDGKRPPARPTSTRKSTRSPVAQIREAIKGLVTTAQQAAPVAAKGGAFGLGTLPFLLLFLLVQKRLDERDPKLALAPSYENDYLTFDDATVREGGLLA